MATSETNNAAARDSPLFCRDQSHHERCCVQCKTAESLPTLKLMRCSRCKFVQCCSLACQKQHFDSHKRVCKQMDRLSKQTASDPNKWWELGKCQFLEAHRCCCGCSGCSSSDETSTNNHHHLKYGAHLYEQVLNSYLEIYERLRATAGYRFALIHLRSRVPFFLAALGHDDLAICDGPRTPGTTKDSDVMKMGMQRMPRVLGTSWPNCFLLPLLLVKLRIVEETKRKLELFDVHKATPVGRRLEAVESDVLQRFMHHPDNPDYCANQTNQLNFVVATIDEEDAELLDFITEDDYDYDTQEVFVDDTRDVFLPVAELHFVRDCFQRNPKIRSLLDAVRTDLSEIRESDAFTAYFQSLFEPAATTATARTTSNPFFPV